MSNYPCFQMICYYTYGISKNSTGKLLEMTNFINMPGYRINLQKSLGFSIHQQHSQRKRNHRHKLIHNDLKENVSVQLERVCRRQESTK